MSGDVSGAWMMSDGQGLGKIFVLLILAFAFLSFLPPVNAYSCLNDCGTFCSGGQRCEYSGNYYYSCGECYTGSCWCDTGCGSECQDEGPCDAQDCWGCNGAEERIHYAHDCTGGCTCNTYENDWGQHCNDYDGWNYGSYYCSAGHWKQDRQWHDEWCIADPPCGPGGGPCGMSDGAWQSWSDTDCGASSCVGQVWHSRGCSGGCYDTPTDCGTDYCAGTCGSGANGCTYHSAGCSGGCYDNSIDLDTGVGYCNACKGANYWALGGEAAPTTCCGDDSSEVKNTDDKYNDPLNIITWAGGTSRCCTADKCVSDAGTCYAGTTNPGDFGNPAYMPAGLNPGGTDNMAFCYGAGGVDGGAGWLDCDRWYNSWCASASLCGSAAGLYSGEASVGEYPDTATLACCGDDLNETTRTVTDYAGASYGTIAWNTGATRCCTASTDQINYNSQCVTSGSGGSAVDTGYTGNDKYMYPYYSDGWLDLDGHASWPPAFGANVCGGSAWIYMGAGDSTGEKCSTAGGTCYDAGQNDYGCCGDDAGESYRTCVAGTGFPDTGVCDSSDRTCCNAATDCTPATGSGTCVTSGTEASDGDGDGNNDYCLSGTWYDCNTNSGCNAGTGYRCSSNNCINTCTQNSDCLAGWYCSQAGTCASKIGLGGICAYSVTFTDNSGQSNGACTSGFCRDDYDASSNGNSTCDTASEECWCTTVSTDCEHNGVAYATGNFAPDCVSVRYRRACSSAAWVQSTDCYASDTCSDNGTSSGAGTCNAARYACSAGACGVTSATAGNDTCTGSVDVPTITYYSCTDVNANGVNDNCNPNAGTACGTDTCSKPASSCTATNYACGGAPRGACSSAGSSGTDSCGGAGSPNTCANTTYICINNDGGSTADTCSATGANMPSGYVCSGNGVVTAGGSTYYCGQSVYNGCTGTGSPYSCQKKRDYLACSGSNTCTVDVGDQITNITSGYVCNAGSENSGSNTFYAFTDSADRCSAPTDPNTGLGDPQYDTFACDGANGQGPDVGDINITCSGCCYDAGATASCISAGDYNQYDYYNFGTDDTVTDYCLAADSLKDCYNDNDCAATRFCNTTSYTCQYDYCNITAVADFTLTTPCVYQNKMYYRQTTNLYVTTNTWMWLINSTIRVKKLILNTTGDKLVIIDRNSSIAIYG